MNISKDAIIYRCADLYQEYVISQDVEDRDKYLKVYNTLDTETKRQVLHVIATNLKNTKLDIIPTYETTKVR